MLWHILQDKTAMGWLAVAIMLAAYSFQIWRTLFGTSQPNPVAWFGFGFLTGAGYFAQAQTGAAAGSWVMGLTAIFCFIVAGVSYVKHRAHWKEVGWKAWDIAAFVLGAVLFALYWMCKNLAWGPVTAASLATAADLVLYTPIIRQTFSRPHEECATAYALNSAKFIPSFIAMGSYSLATCLYPAALVLANASAVAWLLWRRRVVSPSAAASSLAIRPSS